MKFTTNAKWLEKKLSHADDSEVSAGGTSLDELKKAIDKRTITPNTIAGAPTELGKVVRFVRERKGLSRTELASLSRIGEDEIEAIETLSNPAPSPRAMVNLADVLELSKNRLKELAGFVKSNAANGSSGLAFAAKSNRIDSISDDEYESIRALVETLSSRD